MKALEKKSLEKRDSGALYFEIWGGFAQKAQRKVRECVTHEMLGGHGRGTRRPPACSLLLPSARRCESEFVLLFSAMICKVCGQAAERRVNPYRRPDDAAKLPRNRCATEKCCWCLNRRKSVPPNHTTVKANMAHLLLRQPKLVEETAQNWAATLAEVLVRQDN